MSWQLSQRSRSFLELAGRRWDDPALVRMKTLTRATARGFFGRAGEPLVIAHAADPEALVDLRAAGVSYFIEKTGEAYLAQRRPEASLPPTVRQGQKDDRRNPFAVRASRISRLLLLHSSSRFTVTELSELCQLNESVVSRTVRALADEGFADVRVASHDQRVREVSLRDPAGLLARWDAAWRRERPDFWRLDIGTRSVADTQRVVADTARATSLSFAISGLAAAYRFARAVEPADVLVLVPRATQRRWEESLMARSRATERGLLRLAGVPDAFIFDLVDRENGIDFADPVQVWLDTRAAGERAREASDAIAAKMDWL